MTAVRAAGLGKAYRRYRRPLDRALEWVGGSTRHSVFWAVRDVSFDLDQGASLGIVGDNGAGKTTLLAMLASAAIPSTGRLEVFGRVSSILELGAGFHGEFTGRENIFLSAAAQGFGRAEIAKRVDEIVDFSELGEFIDQPVRTYSSGMFLRLAFSIATAVDPEVLVIDEALAVGDQRFQAKCAARIDRFVSSGRTLVFCSHNLYQVKKLCRQAIWLDSGRVAAQGPAHEVVDRYADRARGSLLSGRIGLADGSEPLLRIRRVEAHDGSGEPLRQIETGTSISLTVWVERQVGCDIEPGVAVGLVRGDGVVCFCTSTELDGASLRPAGSGAFQISVRFPELPLFGGSYHFNVATIDNRQPLIMFDVQEGEAPFSVINPKTDWGVCRLAHVWEGDPPGRASRRVEDGGGRA
jgi:lipopolysaccharide transport system ATP-binding protein